MKMDVSLIEKYLEGTATPEETLAVLEWFQTEEGEHYLDHRFQLDLEQFADIEGAFQRSENASRTLEKLDRQINRQPLSNHHFYRKSSILAVAACIAFLIVAISLMDNMLGITELNSETPVSIMIHTTGYGEQKIIQMSDGSSIRLNENSRLEMPEQFTGGNRKVRLQGQAYFEIEHDSERPFSVYAGEALIRVLGTSFAINEASRIGQIQVTVTEGVVSLGSVMRAEEAVVLEREMIGLFDTRSLEVVKEDVDVNNYLSWMYGRVVYDKTPFRDVIRQLERIYEISSVVVDEELLDLRLTADFSERSLMNVLEVIAHSLEIEFTMRGDVVEWRRAVFASAD